MYKLKSLSQFPRFSKTIFTAYFFIGLSLTSQADGPCPGVPKKTVPYELLLDNLLLGNELNETSSQTLKQLGMNVITDIAYSTDPLIKDPLIYTFLKVFHTNRDELLHPKISWYPTFNAFFTRALKPGARVIDPEEKTIVSPVDGTVSESGVIDGLQMIQAKGKLYSVEDLLNDDQKLADEFFKGSFVTFYLSPGNYHRVHMPFSGTLRKIISIPGTLHRVDPHHAESISNLYVKNERMIAVFDGKHGPFVMVLVGAENVGRIETSWLCMKPGLSNEVVTLDYSKEKNQITLEKGVEMGLFNLGSTVILLFPQNQGILSLTSDDKRQMGKRIGTY